MREGSQFALCPHLTVRDVARSARWYARALGFQVRLMLPGGVGGAIRHAEIEHGGVGVMLGPESPERGLLSPHSRGTPPSVSLFLRVASVDAAHAQAVSEGAHPLVAPGDQFFGARTAVIADPDGHQWMLAEQHRQMSEGELREVLEKEPRSGARGHAAARQLRKPRTPHVGV